MVWKRTRDVLGGLVLVQDDAAEEFVEERLIAQNQRVAFMA
jgi:hypothetical protein